MQFAPKTEEQLIEESLLPEGEYPFEVHEAEDKLSSKGNEMIELVLKVYRPDGQFNYVRDWLLESMMFKLIHACEACGLSDSYNTGNINARDFVGKTGTLKLKIQDATDDFPASNKVKDYVVNKEEASSESVVKDDSIPF